VTILVLFGLEAEWAPWRARHPFHRITGPTGFTYETQIGRSLIRAAIVGIGATRVNECSHLWRGGVDAIVVPGLAGSLRADCARGDVIVAGEVRSANIPTPVTAAPELVAAAVRCGARQVRTLLSVERVVGRAADKALLASSGDAVDMESFTVMSEARRDGVAGIAIRVIGDTVDEDLPIDFNDTVRADGTIDNRRLLLKIVARPHKWPAFMPFAFRQWRALRQLARFLDEFIAALP
jgi:nucleoside phosphorylase